MHPIIVIVPYAIIYHKTFDKIPGNLSDIELKYKQESSFSLDKWQDACYTCIHIIKAMMETVTKELFKPQRAGDSESLAFELFCENHS